MFEIKGKTGIVTGSASGIGFATAKMLLEKGANVVMTDYNEEMLHEQYQSLHEIYGDKVTSIAGNVTNEAFMKGLVELAVEKYGELDIMVNNAGTAGKGKKIYGDDESIDDFNNVFNVNVNGLTYGGKYASEQMIKQGHGGAIINTSSMVGVIGTKIGGTGYCGSKHAVVGITKSWALELAEFNIRVNALCPGYTMTGILNAEKYGQAFIDTKMQQVPLCHGLGRLGTPEDQAHAIIFMIENSYMTGQYVVIDGGYTIQ